MKRLAIIGITLILASCAGETTVIREVQVTAAPETIEIPAETPTEKPERYSRSEAIAFAQENAPSLRQFDDDAMDSFMATSCEAIDSWAPDYEGYLYNLRSNMESETISDRDEILAIVVASIYSVCTEHQLAIIQLLEDESDAY